MANDKKLIIVESPAKAKTIGRFLGSDYLVEASIGHIRDLPQNASEIPDSVKKEKWARLGVNVDKGFEPLYVIPADKKKQVAKLKAAMKDAGSILLATDEDREGESISWHILQVLAPKKGMDVRRIVFHEVTKEAIEEALRTPRQVNESLVKAQEARRVLDRLFGYTLSPLLWKKVVPGLSAGRVQSVAVRLTVERERERAAFRSSDYWDLVANIQAKAGSFGARLIRIGDAPLADGKAFDPETGAIKSTRHRLLAEQEARDLAIKAINLRPWLISKLTESPGTQSPYPPFTTSTLQQEANRKLRFTSKRTMQAAQHLYEGIDLGGERVGLITYMRTDSVTLSEKALEQCRRVIKEMYGAEYLPPGPIRYKTKSKGAQEAHEAIRPTDLSRKPQGVRRHLDDDQFKVYELIWKRTVASQMLPARIKRTNVDVTVGDMVFAASGKQILFPGYLRAYVEGSDDPEAELEDQEVLLPVLTQGEEVQPLSVDAEGHSTKPPARYTEASLVKKLEEEGIGRPSTYATVITTIQDRGYIFKRKNELVPTFTAFAVTQLLEIHFDDLVDLKFTAHMEDELDDIARGEMSWDQPLREFYFGKKNDGIAERVKIGEAEAEFPSIRIGDQVVVKVGRYGPYVQRGQGGQGNVASVPEDTAPAEMTEEIALQLISDKGAEPETLGSDPEGRQITLQKGRFGDYLQVAANGDNKPRNISLPPGVAASEVTPEMAAQLALLPRAIGAHPETGDEISAAIGRYGPFVKHGNEYRNLDDWRLAATITLEEALELLAEPKESKRAGGKPSIIKEMNGLKVMSGRFGPYVSDGETNATLPKGVDPAALGEAQARDLLSKKKAAGPAKRPFRRKRKG
ncbi:MAG: type I DNA topoisomerase [Armatimonadetes bacterium]|nr:type I DNA topoisomerase [Armatimonadota bacterium]